LAGVFGGENSEIDDNTKNIALEAAYFTPQSNRKSSRSVGYKSEACSRFERGIDIEAIHPALMRAMQLLVELADAKIEGVVEDGNNKLEPIDITLRYAQIKRILGCDIAPEKCITILENLGFEKLGDNAAAAKFRVPSYRAGDVTREIDLIEEISRINGFDKITPTLPNKNETPEILLEEKVIKKVNNIMLSSGLDEIITSSLIGKPLLERFMINYDDTKAVKVLNSASEECTMLRQGMAPSVLNCLKGNWDNGQKTFWAYEIGKKYTKEGEIDEKHTGVKESRVLAGVLTGEVENSKWQVKTQTDFFTLKGIIEKLFEELDVVKRIKLTPCEDIDYMHPYRSAKVNVLGKNLTTIGYFGQVHPGLKDKMKIKGQEVFLFELDLDALIDIIKEKTPRYKKLPQFPEVKRDLAFVINEEVSFDDIQKVIKSAVQQNIFKGSEVFDVYQGENIDEGYKSLAFRIKMQDENATLTDEVIERQMNNVRAKLQKEYSEISFRE
jgi:phenylalanyl-tRNA synthetase beta chain